MGLSFTGHCKLLVLIHPNLSQGDANIYKFTQVIRNSFKFFSGGIIIPEECTVHLAQITFN
jgi:hypothetical protein